MDNISQNPNPNLQPQFQSPEQPMTPEPGFDEFPKPKNYRSYFLIAIIVLVGAAAYGGIWWWGNRNVKTLTPTATPTYDTTADWQTYRNEQYGFEFKYPANLYDKTDEYAFRVASSPLEIATGGVLPEGIEGKDFVMSGYEVYVSKEDQKNVDLISKDFYVVKKLNYPKITAYEISGDVPSAGPNVYVKNPNAANSYIRIGYKASCSDSKVCTLLELDKLFDQILSTFKFIEPVVCIQVITPARNPQTGEVRDFPTPCDVPQGWEKI